MKTPSFILTLVFASISFFAGAQTAKVKTEKFKVWGNCGMCQKHIEKAAKEAGATAATWNKDSKMLVVKYDPSKATNLKIQEAVAAAGYDTRDLTGNNAAYQALDECCQYDRKPAKEKAKQ